MEGFCEVCEHEEDHDLPLGKGVCRHEGCGCDGSQELELPEVELGTCGHKDCFCNSDPEPLPDTYDGPAVRLMADIMQANSDSLSRTTNRVLDAVEADRDEYANMLIDFHAEVMAATDVVTTRALERLLWKWEQRIARVASALERRES